MIVKEKNQTSSSSIKLDAGIKQEHDVAFHLRRAYKDRDNVMVLNDICILHNGERAQIDHLIVYSFGFIVVESKSIRGEVRVNEHKEWSRSYKGVWSGIPSPIKQAELQLTLLKQLLLNNASKLLGKLLGMQQSFGGRCFDVFCAISSDAMIDRSKAPAGEAEKLVKSEFVVEALDRIMNFKSHFQIAGRLADSRPSFTQLEMNNICDFLLGFTASEQKPTQNSEPDSALQYDVFGASDNAVLPAINKAVVDSTKQPTTLDKLKCKHCGERDGLSPLSGKYGYFVQCSKCKGNTPMRMPCPVCNSFEGKVRKSKLVYILDCKSCGTPSDVFVTT